MAVEDGQGGTGDVVEALHLLLGRLVLSEGDLPRGLSSDAEGNGVPRTRPKAVGGPERPRGASPNSLGVQRKGVTVQFGYQRIFTENAEPTERLLERFERWNGRLIEDCAAFHRPVEGQNPPQHDRSEEHTSELQSRLHLVCRLLLEKKKDRCTPRY